MKKTAFFSDLFFTLFLAWLFTLCVFRYWKLPFITALLLSAVCGILTACAVAAILQSKRKSVFLKRSDEAEKRKLLYHLALVSDEAKALLFLQAFAKQGEVRRSGKLWLRTADASYFLRFYFAPVTADEVARLARLKTSGQKVIFCAEMEEQAFTLCQKLGLRVETGESVYKFLKTAECLPDRYFGEETGESKRKRIWNACIAKSNAKRFFISGALLLATSLITPFPYYYLVFGTILFAVALCIKILGKNG